MADRCPSGVKEIIRSTWSWACRPRDRCPRLAIYTPGYPAVEEGPSLLGGLPRRPPVVPDGNRAHPSVRNQMSCHAVRPFPYRVKKKSAFFFFLSFFLFSNEGRPSDRWFYRRAGWVIQENVTFLWQVPIFIDESANSFVNNALVNIIFIFLYVFFFFNF